MIRIYCDICQKEPSDKDFVFEATRVQMIDAYDVTGGNLNAKKQMDKKMFQVCRACYEKHLQKLLN